MTWLRPTSLPLTLLMALVLAACSSPTAPPQPISAPAPAPALQGSDFDGRNHDLAQYAGSVVVVSVWASWCGPCREEIPILARAQERLGPEGLIVLGVNFRDNPDAAKQFLAEERPSFPSVADPRGTVAVAWGVAALPQSFLVDRDQRVVARHVGPVTDAWIDATVAAQVRA